MNESIFSFFYLRLKTSLLVVKGTGQPKKSKRKILLYFKITFVV